MDLIYIINRYISFNTNIIFQINIIKNKYFSNCLSKFDKSLFNLRGKKNFFIKSFFFSII